MGVHTFNIYMYTMFQMGYQYHFWKVFDTDIKKLQSLLETTDIQCLVNLGMYSILRFKTRKTKSQLNLDVILEGITEGDAKFAIENTLQIEQIGDYDDSHDAAVASRKRKRTDDMTVLVDVCEMHPDIDEARANLLEDAPDLLPSLNTIHEAVMASQRVKRRRLRQHEATGITWKPWQQRVHDILRQTPNDRDVVVIVDPVGNQGKSYMVRNYGLMYPRESIFVDQGKSTDMKMAVTQALDHYSPRVIFLDLTRTNVDGFNATVVEQLKNGFWMNSKYQSKQVDLYGSPHVVIMCNEHLDYSRMSEDRWKIYTIEDQRLTRYNINNKPLIIQQTEEQPITRAELQEQIDKLRRRIKVSQIHDKFKHYSDSPLYNDSNYNPTPVKPTVYVQTTLDGYKIDTQSGLIMYQY